MDESRKYIKWKKPDTEGQIQYDPLVQNTQNKEIHRNKRSIRGCEGLGEEGKERYGVSL